MTESQKRDILVAKAFAKTFAGEADDAIRLDNPKLAALSALHLYAALQPIIDVADRERCDCGHIRYWHEGETCGMCMHGGCPCVAFEEVNHARV